ncbi:HEAT repeat domain-containing protein [Geothrix sp. 21YS21S-2]|uniref:HEAT repeat domain-containing protein n=1 Tax=Geothrix sp. 21YS21S-2 TaxID=3068893 RepID=UPI0027BAEA40|nr:HEAT repeat domain-containing protein [Geothrix sp. 21YS21S-2]
MPAPKSLTRLIELLHQALRAQLHHAPDHPLALKSQADLEDYLPALLAEFGTIRLVTSGVGFSCQDEPVTGAPNAAMALAREMDAREIGGIELVPGLDPEEIRTLLFILQMRPQRVSEMGGAATLLPDDGLLRVLPKVELPPPRVATPLRASDVELDWEKMFAAPERSVPQTIPDSFDPIPWVSGSPAGDSGPLPPTVPLAFPEPAPLTPEELARVQVPHEVEELVELPEEAAPAPLPAGRPEPAAPLPPSPAALRDELSSLFRSALSATTPVDKAGPRSPWGVDHRDSLKRFGFTMPSYACMAGAGARLMLEAMDPGTIRDALRKAFSEFEPADQGNILLGVPGFPPGEHALRRALDFLAPELLAQAVAHTHVAHRPSMFDLALLTVALMQCVPDRELSLDAIRGRLQFEGWGMQEVEDFKEAIQWECQGTDTKLHMSLERHAIHKLDPHLVMTLGRQLIRGKRVDDIRSMLAQLEEEFSSPQESVRRHGTEILANLAEGLPETGLPLDLENRMLASARYRLSAENDQLVAQWCAQTVEAILNRWIPAGNFTALHNEMRNLGDLAYPSVGAASWKPQLMRDLLARLGSSANIALLVPLLFQKGAGLPIPQVHSILALIGTPAAAHLAVSLEIEEDPSHRTHLVEALRAIGRRAVPVLQEQLASSHWHMVDAALMLLAQAGDKAVLPDMLLAVSHQDMRVRRTAVTAVAALAGKPAAAMALAETLADSDVAAQLETLNLIGDLGEPAALPAVLRMLNPDKASGDDAQRLRLRAVEVLGRIPGNDSVRPLQELFQKKGLFKGREPVGIRIAAAKALAAMNSQEAREAMAMAMENEPTEEVKAVLRQYLIR